MVRIAIMSIAGLAMTAPASAASEPITGRWLTDNGKAIVEISPCGASLCGTIQRIVGGQSASARDVKNPDKAKRNRSLVGVTVLSNLKAADGGWTGQGYSPEQGRNFNATVTAAGGKLNIRGCVTLGCRTSIWTRAR